MGASYEELKSAFLALQRLAPARRQVWLASLADRDPSLHVALASFLAFEAEEGAEVHVVDPADDVGPGPVEGTRYEDRGLLGVGGIGEVRRVYDPSLDRTVALKFLRSRHVHEPDPERRAAAERRFVAEARIQASFHHPGILPVYERGLLPDGRPYLTMAVARGRTLRAWLDEIHTGQVGSAELEGLVRAWVAVCEAVQHAHDQGVLHRDLKPSNVMVDEAGEAVVVDWGLALGAGEGRAAGIAGTPAYMAPEQLDPAAPLDERTDVYALGGILHAVLSGRDPERGVTLPPGPKPLTEAVARAMDPDAAARPASAAALADVGRAWIEGLERESRSPGWRRGALAVGLLAVGTLGGAVVWAFWPDAADAEAMRRLEALRETVAEHRAAGDAPAVDRAFQAFVGMVEHEGTAALAEAWLDRADVLAERGENRDHRRALAAAFAESRTPEQGERALLALVRAQTAGERWAELAATLDVLERRAPDLMEELAVREAVWRLAVASRRFDERGAPPRGPFAALEPLVRALARGQRLQGTPGPGRIVPWDADGDGVATLWEADRSGMTLLLPALGTGEPLRVDWPASRAGVGVGAVRVDGEDLLVVPYEGRMDLLGPAPGGLQLRGSWPAAPPLNPFVLAAADLDGDGQDEILQGFFAARRLDLVARDASGTWRVSTPEGSTNAANSEVRGLRAGDLDGDGDVEVAVAMGAWGAYDLRLVALAEGRLELLSRRKLGALHAMATVRAPDGLELATLVNAGAPRPRDFPAEQVTGVPTGLYRSRVTSDGLSEPRFTPLNRNSGGLVALDVDGDGVDELAIQSGDGLWLGRFDDGGELVGLHLSGVELLGAGDVDRDGTDELVVKDEESGSRWVLGVGGEALPARVLARPRDTLPLPSGWLAEGVSRADDLFAMGFPEESAAELEGLAALSEDGPERARVLLRAARTLEITDHLSEAGRLFERAASQDPALHEAVQGAARCAERLHRFRHARELLHAVSADEAASLGSLADASRWRLQADTPLAGIASAVEPLGVSLDPSRERLVLTGSGGGVLLRVPMRRTGERLGLELDAELLDLVWSSGLGIALRPVGAHPPVEVGLSIHAHGGGGHVATVLGTVCGGPSRWHGHRVSQGHAPALGAVRVRVDCVPERGHGVAGIEGPDVAVTREFVVDDAFPEGGDWELVLLARETADRAPLLARLALERLVVTGAEPVGVAVTPEARAAEALIRGRPGEALEHAGMEEGRRLRALALADLGRVSEAVDLLDPGADDPWSRSVLRTRPDIAGEWVRREGEAAIPALWAAWEASVEVDPDDWGAVRALTEGPLGTLPLDRVPETLRARILLARGAAWRHLGRVARAEEALGRAAGLPVSDPDLAADIATGLARLALLRDDRDAAMDHVREALEHSPAPEVLADRLAADPSLAQLASDPRWRALPGVTRPGTAPSGAR